MNSGLIPARYAKALLEFATVNKEQDKVYNEAKAITNSYSQLSELRVVLDNPVLANAEKRKIIQMAAGGKISSSLERFMDLILENNREKYLHEVALKVIDLYRKQKDIHYGKLTTASEVDAAIEKRLMTLVAETTGGTIEMEKVIDPEILGGFLFEVDFVRWDASVSGQLRRIRKEYIEKNNKTV